MIKGTRNSSVVKNTSRSSRGLGSNSHHPQVHSHMSVTLVVGCLTPFLASEDTRHTHTVHGHSLPNPPLLGPGSLPRDGEGVRERQAEEPIGMHTDMGSGRLWVC